MSFLRWWWGLLLAFALVALVRVFLPLPFANEIIIFSIYTMGCNYLLGRVGFISFGQPAYLAVGAYAAAFYLFYFGNNPYVGILIGIAAGIVVSFAIGPLFVRLARRLFRLGQSRAGGDHLLSHAEGAGRHHARRQRAVVPHQPGVDAGAGPVAARPVLHLRLPGRLRAVGVLQISRRLDLRRLLPGDQDQRGQGEIPRLQQLQYPAAAFVIANTTTALAGAMYAVYLGFVSPEITSPARAADPVVVTILGGVGTLYGPLVGSIVYTGMKDVLSKVLGNWELVIGFVLVFIMLAGEKGIWGTLEPLIRKTFLRITGKRPSAREQPMISMQLLTSGIIFGLSLGSIFFLMTIGLSLCFGLMRIISLDQLLYYSVGAYITYSVSLALGNIWLGVLAGAIVAGLSALAVERIVFRRIYDRDLPFTMITSFGVLIGGVGVIKYFWGLVPRPVPEPIAAQVDIIGTDIPVYRLVIVAIAALVYVGIWLFLNRTIIGKAIRAGTEDVEHVEGLGINVYRLFTITFVIAGALSGLAGGLHAPLIMVDPNMGLDVLAFVFMVVIIGGLGSIKGTLISSFLVGQVVSIGSLVYAPLAQMAPFAIMLLILLIKPTGLFGSQMLKR